MRNHQKHFDHSISVMGMGYMITQEQIIKDLQLLDASQLELVHQLILAIARPTTIPYLAAR